MFTLKTNAAGSSKMFVPNYQTAWGHIPEATNPQSQTIYEDCNLKFSAHTNNWQIIIFVELIFTCIFKFNTNHFPTEISKCMLDGLPLRNQRLKSMGNFKYSHGSTHKKCCKIEFVSCNGQQIWAKLKPTRMS
jgi:hypothetical protein